MPVEIEMEGKTVSEATISACEELGVSRSDIEVEVIKEGSKGVFGIGERLAKVKVHYRVGCIRQDALHKLTTTLTEDYRHIAIEDLNVKGMMSSHTLALTIADMGFSEFRRQLEYKAKVRGNHITLVDRYYPSSKLCSSCGEVNPSLGLSDRVFHCPQCDLRMDRDLNAAINLQSTVSSTGS